MPFTTERFLQVFAAYNTAIWPAQILLLGVALIAVYYAIRPGPRPTKIPTFILTGLWGWSGFVYHILFFREINPLAVAFGIAFVVQAALLIVATLRGHLHLVLRPIVAGWIGGGMIVYALVLYPLLGMALGHSYPRVLTFGAPCPVTIFTLGLLLWNTQRTPWYVVVVPVLWSAIGVSAAVQLSVREDLGLGLAGLVTLIVLVLQRVAARGRTLFGDELRSA